MLPDLTEFLEAVRGLSLNSITVLKEGVELTRFETGVSTMGNLYSGTKSFTSAAAGFAVSEGLFSPEDRVADCFRDALPDVLPPEFEELRLRHLLSMSMGLEKPLLLGAGRESARKNEPDWVRYCLRQPFSDRPGSHFMYTNAGPYLMGVLIQKRSGQSLREYLKPRLLDPLEIELPRWEECPSGYVFGSSGFYTDLDALARFGQLYLQKGRWKGRQLLPEEWVDYSTRKQICPDEDEEFCDGYALGFWTMPEEAYLVLGKYEQYCLILPRKQAVVAIKAMNTAGGEDQPILRAAMEYVVDQI